jgi:hypothetical protein
VGYEIEKIAASVWTRASICFVFPACNEPLQGAIVGEYLRSAKSKIPCRILAKFFVTSVLASICAFSLIMCSICLLISALNPSSPYPMSSIQLCIADVRESIPSARYCVLFPISSIRITPDSISVTVALPRWLKSTPTIASNQLGNLQDVLLN